MELTARRYKHHTEQNSYSDDMVHWQCILIQPLKLATPCMTSDILQFLSKYESLTESRQKTRIRGNAIW